MEIYKVGTIFVLSAPSGTGKTTICERLIKSLPNLKMSISHTTRKPRIGERDGVDYFFVDREVFETMIKNNDFVEWAEVYGNFYGTSKKVINELFQSGNDVLLDIDIQGAKNIKKTYPDSVLIFILPPSLEELEKRLKQRKEEIDTIKMRLNKVKEEISQYKIYDYLVINDDLDKAVKEILCIITAEKLKTNKVNQQIINNF
ncbi:guanylate kinase [Thermodesulfovibrio sp. 1176]|uniref:guanylate kinase n=1 Tax=Thermodesulfovibrio sp. N1 TaxID=1871110 RepID=UPI00083AAF7E|nr:guanylate kinase [Thermodesulfovibrio sp. N1]MDI1470973.1 guanylate kinase [Thermodesulfovibrio sp. 1176]